LQCYCYFNTFFHTRMTIVVVGAVNSLSAAGGLSASALAGATVGGGVGLAGRLVNAGGPASTVGSQKLLFTVLRDRFQKC
jgi:hypothetical protein